MTILPLYAAPQFAPQVTDWLWQAFGGETLPRQFFASIVQHSQTAGGAAVDLYCGGRRAVARHDWPLALRFDQPPGSVSRLAALFVAPAARGQGLAGKLQRHVIDYARRAGFRELYLYSACRDFYERFGWRYIGEGLDYPATAVHLYRYDLSPSCGATTE
ncbi:GNAT family N-acetyltransferase [Klebsiella pneumoniae subsp. pneumoniae]|nr:GNAT family N-acetyltransferase [Klebsiella pneumoniae subsp. pneumoniae]